jgi:hypothetical protein
MPGESNQSSGLKWLIGVVISLLAAGSGTVALLTYFGQKPQGNFNANNTIPSTPTPTSLCSIDGKVYNSDNNQPLANVEVGYFRRTQDKTDYDHDVKSRLATTGVDGSFNADCSNIEAENFPLRLQLSSRNWQTTIQTNEYVRRGPRSGINLYVSDSLQRKLH